MSSSSYSSSDSLALQSASAFEPAHRTGQTQGLSRPSLSYWKDAWLRLKKNKQALLSLWIIVGLVAFSLLGPWIWSADPSEQVLSRISEGPTLSSSVTVLPPLPEYQEVIREDIPAYPEDPSVFNPAQLPAPQNLRIITAPSPEGVQLQWEPVAGADGYTVYRGSFVPSIGQLGIPIGDVDAGNKVSYFDQFDIKMGTVHYAVVPKLSGEESQEFASIEVTIPRAMTLVEAQLLRPDVQPGQSLPQVAHPLGTDYLGRDLLARIIAGARVSLFIGFIAPLLSVAIGIVIGGIAGFFGGRTDAVLMRVTDFVLALPFLLFMILFKVVLGGGPGENGIIPMLIAMIALSWTGPARLTRGQILQLRESEFVQASKLLGAKPLYLIFRHLLPNTLGVILVSLTFAIPSAIFTEAFLSFIGMGVVPPTPSWGSLCNDGIQTFLTHPHEFIFPALIISITVLAFNLLGDGLRDALDPKMRSLS